MLRDDLRFIRTKFKLPYVVWHDPNFGIRFDDYLGTIEEAIPGGSIRFIAESSLSILNEERLKRLNKNGFVGMLPGVESWYDLGGKSRTGKRQGIDKVTDVAEHINMIMRYIPYMQANFVMGLDSDSGSEPFELTRKFIDLSPGAFPGYSLLSAFGRAAPLNLSLQKDGRVLPFPFHFLNNNGAMNVQPVNYDWKSFYDNVIDTVAYSFSKRSVWRRWRANNHWLAGSVNVLRGVSQEGTGRLKYHREIRRRLDEDPQFLPFFEGRSECVPDFYLDIIKKDLGSLYDYLPDSAMFHDQNAYMKAEAVTPQGVKISRTAAKSVVN